MFFGAFLGPIFAILLFNTAIFIIVIVILIRHTRRRTGKVKDKSQQKSNIRIMLSLLGIMFLFGLTWLFAAFTIREASVVFQILFAVFNSFQGFFIFLFFCVLSTDVRQLWLQALSCGRYTPKGLTSTGGRSTGTARPEPGARSSHTALSGLSTLRFGSVSDIPLSEHPTSTVMGNEFATIEEEDTFEAPNPTAPPAAAENPPSYVEVFRNVGAGVHEYGALVKDTQRMSVTFGSQYAEL